MANSIFTRRVVAVRTENTGVAFANQGTHNPPVASTDAIPMLRSAKATADPVRVDRPTIRLSLTGVADIFPNKSVVTLDFSFELTATSAYVSGAGVTSSMRPLFNRVIQGCGYSFLSEQTANLGVYAYALTSIAGTNPLQHNELIVGTGTPGAGNRVVGDTYGDDGALFIDQGATAPVGTPFTGQTSGSVATVGARQGTECFAWYPQSQLPDPSSAGGTGQQTLSLSMWNDGKLLRIKGAMGNCTFEFNHGDAVVCNVSMRGVVVDYADGAMPASPNEAHKYPPTFLGSRLTLRQPVNAPTAVNQFGTDGAGTGKITGALNKMTIETGNEVTLRENSMDPNGINYATIQKRKPKGSFNPDEVSSLNDFDFVTRFVGGVPTRLRATVVGPGATTWAYNNPATFNQNAFAFIAPGIVFSGMADAERDGIQIWDAGFDLSGGDYDTTALGEEAGNDNELVLLHF